MITALYVFLIALILLLIPLLLKSLKKSELEELIIESQLARSAANDDTPMQAGESTKAS